MTIFQTTAALLAFSLTAAGTSASAHVNEKAGGQVASEGGQGATKADTSSRTKYCVVEKFTGSRIPTKICKTKKEWQQEGIDITAQ